MVEPLQDQQGQEKLRLLRTWQRHWLFNAWSSTAQMVWTLRLWVVSSVGWLREALGLALMSLIVSISKCFL